LGCRALVGKHFLNLVVGHDGAALGKARIGAGAMFRDQETETKELGVYD